MNEKVSDKTVVWAIYFVGFEDPQAGNPDAEATDDNTVEPRVGYERVETTTDGEQQRADADLTALLRGGQVLAIVEDDDEATAAAVAAALEKEILRLR
jgi:hypothetical protein